MIEDDPTDRGLPPLPAPAVDASRTRSVLVTLVVKGVAKVPASDSDDEAIKRILAASPRLVTFSSLPHLPVIYRSARIAELVPLKEGEVPPVE